MRRPLIILSWLILTTGTATSQVQEGYPFPAICMDPETLTDGVYIAHPGSELCYHNEIPFSASANAEVKLRSPERIHLKENVIISDLNSTGRFHAKIEAEPFDVRIISPDPAMGAVIRNQRFEVGVRPTANVMSRIQSFIDYTLDKDYPHGTYNGSNPYNHEELNQSNALNPFMSWDIRVYGTYELVDENWNAVETKTYEGFYYEDWQRVDSDNNTWDDDWIKVDTELPFRIRAALGKQGMWRCTFFVEVEGQLIAQSNSNYIQVTNSGGEGFVQVAANNMYLEKDDESFFPVGRNNSQPNCHPNDDPNCTAWQYTPAVEEMNGPMVLDPWHSNAFAFQKFENEIQGQYDEGCRYFRYITVHNTDDLEHELLGNYYKRLKLGNELDRIIEKVESLEGMHLHWVMNIGRNLGESGAYHAFYYDWRDLNDHCQAISPTPYSNIHYKDAIANAYHKFISDVENPMDFFSDQEAMNYYKEKLRYMIARWGYSTRISQMDLMSEIGNLGGEAIYYNYLDEGDPISEIQCKRAGARLLRYKGKAYKLENPDPFYIYNEQDQPVIVEDPENDLEPVGDIIAAWQSEMARYIKEDLQHTDHLIGINYGHNQYPKAETEAQATSTNDEGDCSFVSPHIDVLTFNYIDYGEPGPHRFYRLAGDISRMRTNMAGLGFMKPILVTETGTHVGQDPCDHDTEWIREVLASGFTGLAGTAMPWAPMGV